MSEAAQITRRSRSNLALAFITLGPKQRRDITTFYAFCRVIDDLADSPALPLPEKQAGLDAWRRWLVRAETGEPSLAPEIRALLEKYERLSVPMFEEIIAGVEMDLRSVRYATWPDLRLYCHRVASAVGLVSIEIFGYRNPRCRDYAVALGLALQTTNIIRDVGKDLRLDRIYLPLDELARFGLTEADLRRAPSTPAFLALMQFQAARSEVFYGEAAVLLPAEDRRAMIAAQIMAAIYHTLLRRMAADQFRVFAKEYRLGRLQKAALVLRTLLRGGKKAGFAE